MSHSRPGAVSRFSSKGAFDALPIEDVPSDDEEPVIVEQEAQPVTCAGFFALGLRVCANYDFKKAPKSTREHETPDEKPAQKGGTTGTTRPFLRALLFSAAVR